MSTNQFNQLSVLPYIPYNIITYLFSNENLWKLLYYPTVDCLAKDDLTDLQKSQLIWSGQDQQQDYGVFFTSLVENMIYESKTILKVYSYDIIPVNHLTSVVAMEIDIICGGKIVLVESDGILCNRLDLIKSELFKSLNGCDVAGVGMLQFNSQLSQFCNSRIGYGNDRTFTGSNVIFAVEISNVSTSGCS